jgi:2-polyprenyl-3-methyl-5-hydroxy-6-metoxy-1,4-benzoquinol methylase
MSETATWIDYWQEENAFDESMSMNYAYFLDRVEAHVSITPQTAVLDIGSGPGLLANAWWNRVGRLVGLDISKRYNDQVRTRHADHPSVTVYDLPADDFLNFSVLGEQRFDLVIVMSVLQYYPDITAVERLLTNVKRLVNPGAKVLLCDLIVDGGMTGDIVSVLMRSWRERRLLSMLSLLVRLRFSAYYGVRQQNGFLVIPKTEWQAICQRMGLKARFLPEPITLQHDRLNLLIEF